MSQVAQGQDFVGVSERRTTRPTTAVDPVCMMAGRLVNLLRRFDGSLRTEPHATYSVVTNQLLHDRLLDCEDAGGTTREVRRTIIAAFEKLEVEGTIRRDDHNRRIVLKPSKRKRGRGRSRQRYTNNPRVRARRLAWT